MRRKQLAINIAAKGQATVTLDAVQEVLRAAREAGYLIIDKDRVVDVHASHRFREEERDLIPKMMDHVRNRVSVDIGRYLLDKGGIEFEELDGGMELRSTAYVIWPNLNRTLVRDETHN